MPKDPAANPRRRGRPPYQYKLPPRADAPAAASDPPPPAATPPTDASSSINTTGQQDFSALLPPIDPDLMQRVLDPVQHEQVNTLSEFEGRESAGGGAGGRGERLDQVDPLLQPAGYYASGVQDTPQVAPQAPESLALPISPSNSQSHLSQSQLQPPSPPHPPTQPLPSNPDSSTRVTHPLDVTRTHERQALWDLVASCDYVPGTPADARGDLREARLNGVEGKEYALATNNGFVKPTRQKKLEGGDYFRETIEIEDIPRFFDSLPHDYNILSRARSSCHFHITWLDPPGLIPTDIRSRHMRVSVDGNALRNNPNGYIYRVIYKCSGSCMRVDSEAEAGGSYGHSLGHQHDAGAVPVHGGAGPTEGQAAAEADEGARPRTKGQAVCDSLLMLEITCRMAANGQCAVVRKRPEYHPEGPVSTLRMSAYMRSVLHELVAETGMPDKRLRVEYEERICRAPYAAWLEREFSHRAPRPRHYNSVISAITRNKLGRVRL